MDLHVWIHLGSDDRFKAIEARLTQMSKQLDAIYKQGERIMATEQQVRDALAKINDATNTIAATEQAEADTMKRFATDLQSLASRTGIPDDVVTTLTDIGTRMSASATTSAANAKALADMAQSLENPVPTPPPAPSQAPRPQQRRL